MGRLLARLQMATAPLSPPMSARQANEKPPYGNMERIDWPLCVIDPEGCQGSVDAKASAGLLDEGLHRVGLEGRDVN